MSRRKRGWIEGGRSEAGRYQRREHWDGLCYRVCGTYIFTRGKYRDNAVSSRQGGILREYVHGARNGMDGVDPGRDEDHVCRTTVRSNLSSSTTPLEAAGIWNCDWSRAGRTMQWGQIAKLGVQLGGRLDGCWSKQRN